MGTAAARCGSVFRRGWTPCPADSCGRQSGKCGRFGEQHSQEQRASTAYAEAACGEVECGVAAEKSAQGFRRRCGKRLESATEGARRLRGRDGYAADGAEWRAGSAWRESALTGLQV